MIATFQCAGRTRLIQLSQFSTFEIETEEQFVNFYYFRLPLCTAGNDAKKTFSLKEPASLDL